MRVVVIGGGIIGSSIAFKISKNAGIDVVHLFPSAAEGMGTTAAGAMLNSIAEIDGRSLSTKESRAYFQHSLSATGAWPKFLAELAEHAGFSSDVNQGPGVDFETGTYVVHNTVSDELDQANFEAIKTTCQEYAIDAIPTRPADIPGYNPESRARATESLLIRGEGWINPHRVLHALGAALKRRSNYTALDGTAKSISFKSGLAKSVLNSDGEEIHADRIVIANGAFLNELVVESRATEIVPHFIYSGVGAAIEVATNLPKIRHCIRTPNRGGACGLYVVPYSTDERSSQQHYMIGASNYVSLVPQYRARAISVAHLLHSATREINQEFYSAEIVNIKVGNRPITFDQYPIVGRTFSENLFVVSGTRRDGFHLAPILSQYIGNLIEFDEDDESFGFLSPKRKPIRDISTRDGIDLNVASLISEAFQHGYQPATIRGYQQFQSSIRAEVEETHERFCKLQYGIPTLMYKLAREGLINVQG